MVNWGSAAVAAGPTLPSVVTWNERCLAFYNSSRTVPTASKLQVHQPIYTRSVARWQRFGSPLEPLRQALGLPGTRD